MVERKGTAVAKSTGSRGFSRAPDEFPANPKGGFVQLRRQRRLVKANFIVN